MFCPFHNKAPGEPTCNKNCPFWHQAGESSEECLLANSIVAIPAKLDHLYNMLEELTEGLITINGNIADMLIRLEANYSEGEAADDTEDGRAGEAVDQGARPDTQEGGNVGVEEGADDRSVQGEGEIEGRTEESPTG